jgi:peptide-methionine (S)-S-oxide reductase
MAKATFGAGCFWGVEEAFRNVPGVTGTAVGYAGGTTEHPTYEDVCTDLTGHAEVVEVEYDPAQVSYDQLLDVFWQSHDPTQRNRQGPDVGTQYRSVIVYGADSQKNVATAYIAQLDKAHVFARPIVTRVERLKHFYPAERYHQDYLENHPTNPYIAYNDLPKIEYLKQLFPGYYSERPVLLAGK